MRHFDDGAAWGVRLCYSVEHAPLGTAGALKLAGLHMRGEAFLALNGDSFFATDVAALREFHRARGAVATLALAEVADTARYGAVETADDGRSASDTAQSPSACR